MGDLVQLRTALWQRPPPLAANVMRPEVASAQCRGCPKRDGFASCRADPLAEHCLSDACVHQSEPREVQSEAGSRVHSAPPQRRYRLALSETHSHGEPPSLQPAEELRGCGEARQPTRKNGADLQVPISSPAPNLGGKPRGACLWCKGLASESRAHFAGSRGDSRRIARLIFGAPA